MEIATVYDKVAAASVLFPKFKQTLRPKTHTAQTYHGFKFHFDFRIVLEDALLFKVRP